MRVLVPLVLAVALPVLLAGCAAPQATCTCHQPLGQCPGANPTGIVHPVPDVRGLSHNTAIAVLTGEGFFNVCCAGSPSHAQHSQSAKVLWQECYEPATMDLGDVVYLSFMPK